MYLLVWLALGNFTSMTQNPLLVTYTFRVARAFSLLIFILLGWSCQKEEIPEYAKHDWYAHYSVDGVGHVIAKDGFDNSFLPSLFAYDSYGYEQLPDNSDSVIFVTLESGFSDKDEVTGNTIGITVVFVLTDENILSSKQEFVDIRIDRLKDFLENRTFVNIPGNRDLTNYVNIALTDNRSNIYSNSLFNNGTYGVILDYVVKIKSVNIIEHPNDGIVLGVELEVEADLEDRNRGGEYKVFAKSRLYLTPPFDN